MTKASVSGVAGPEKRKILLKTSKGNQDYLQGKENAKSFCSNEKKTNTCGRACFSKVK